MRTAFVILAALTMSCSHWAGNAPKPPPVQPKIDVILDGFATGMSEKSVITVLGEPASKDKPEQQAADGMYYTTWKWPAQAIELGLAASHETGPFTTVSVHIAAPNKMKTSSGIGIGSTRAQVEKAYGEAINHDRSEPARFIITSEAGITSLEMSGDKVSAIDIGPPGE